ncbi:MAG: hypothetical protein LBE31_08485 [Deltaproteobacteria bacterium]|jgi:hypothetical protein|nr:hypothetical protein [Deltaproteobacteria bacterium]
MAKHLVKLTLLICGLIFLCWWGWSGNFAFNYGALFSLTDQKTFYQLVLGTQPIGWARREVVTNPDSGELEITEESLLNFKLAGTALGFKTISKTIFDQRGRLVSAHFTVPIGSEMASASAIVDRDKLLCRLSLGGQAKEASLPLPPNGPIVVSGVVPWLGHQRDMPLGRAMGVELLDPISMSFKPGQLTIEDDTAQSAEVQTYKLSLSFLTSQSAQWVDAYGRVVYQYSPSLEAGLVLVDDPQVIQVANLALAGPPPEIPKGAMGDLIEQLISSYGLSFFSNIQEPVEP